MKQQKRFNEQFLELLKKRTAAVDKYLFSLAKKDFSKYLDFYELFGRGTTINFETNDYTLRNGIMGSVKER